MQRTVHGTAVVLGQYNKEAKRVETFTARFAKVFKDEKDLKKAIFKAYGNVVLVSVSEFEELYVLDDALFFKYAHIAGKEETENEPEEDTENEPEEDTENEPEEDTENEPEEDTKNG